MQALLAFSVHEAQMLVRAADVACALSVEALVGTDRPYDERVQVIRPHPGQQVSAANLRALLAGSQLMASHRHSRPRRAGRLLPALRAAGARRRARCALARAPGDGDRARSVVDNPVIVPDGSVMTTGNFHGEPLAFAADMLAIALAELASISERRVDRMLDPAFSRGLPPFLAPEAGTNSGFMLAQYTAASLVSENKVLAHPASVDTIPTSGKQEDHVSMGWTGVRKLREVVANVRSCLAVEILCAAQGIDLRAANPSWRAAPAAAMRAVHEQVRAQVPVMLTDREVASPDQRRRRVAAGADRGGSRALRLALARAGCGKHGPLCARRKRQVWRSLWAEGSSLLRLEYHTDLHTCGRGTPAPASPGASPRDPPAPVDTAFPAAVRVRCREGMGERRAPR